MTYRYTYFKTIPVFWTNFDPFEKGGIRERMVDDNVIGIFSSDDEFHLKKPDYDVLNAAKYVFRFNKPDNLIQMLNDPDKFKLVNPIDFGLTYREMYELQVWCKENGIKTYKSYYGNVVKNRMKDGIRDYDYGCFPYIIFENLEDYIAVKLTWHR